MIPGSANPLLLASAAGAAPSYSIDRSLRFNSSDSAYCSRVFSSASNRKTYTFACWVKRTNISYGFAAYLLRSSDGTQYAQLYFESGTNVLVFDNNGSVIKTAATYRDCSAWFHVVLSVDTSQATSANRTRIYINGIEVSYGSASYPTQNFEGSINNNISHTIGGTGTYGIDGYLADCFLIDGQALDPTSFGEFDTNGIWQPKAYTGSYGTNGFHLDFADNSTTAALGTDTSGNGNTWTVNNISVAAGAGNDSLVDVPTNGTEADTGLGGEVRGNYCTLSPIDSTSGITLSNGNLQVSQNAGANVSTNGSFGVASDKWYWEVQCTSGGNSMVGVADLGAALDLRQYNDTGGLYYYQSTGGLYGYLGGSFSNTPYGSSFPSASDIVGVALDMNTGDVTFYKNGVSQGIANTSTLLGKIIAPSLGNGGATAENVVNFGQRPFAFTAPSGFKALCTANLPSTTITTSGSYTGNGVADGPFVYLNGVPTAMTVNGNAVTFGTHADKLSNGFKIRTTSTTYNLNASVYNYSITSTGAPFKTARAQSN